MAITVKPVDATLGAIVTDVNLAALDETTWQEIHRAFLTYGVLIFPGQHLDNDTQGRFAHRFGNVEQMSPKAETPTFAIANIKADGSLAQPSDYQYQILKGNEGWHTDSTYMPLASKVAMLSALILPPEGGETEFADMRAAWDALSADMQQKLEGLSAFHSLYYSQSRQGFVHKTDNLYGLHDKGEPLRPVVKVHPETGRKSIYTGRHAHGVNGMTLEESEKFLDELLAWACQPPRTWKHTWSVGDLVVWDNRCLMHRACPYDPKYPRHLRGSRVSGEPASELAPTFADPRAAAYNPAAHNNSVLANA
ncbi:MAG: TauD/TfdA family dioxygenase [Gammaproteobacteria bacterium]|nr:TauD/TfdA family dioxygenase [Gammaproteobacteria bacterium]